MKDAKDEDWPLIGICQGHEVISVILGQDNIDTLDEVIVFGKRPVGKWLVNP
jgi:gamma-glutamyl-gamma-aminobutyrate hydrolase PuuD